MSRRIPISEAAEILGVARATLSNYMAMEKLRSRLGAERFGNVWSLDEAKVLAYRDTRKRIVTGEGETT